MRLARLEPSFTRMGSPARGAVYIRINIALSLLLSLIIVFVLQTVRRKNLWLYRLCQMGTFSVSDGAKKAPNSARTHKTTRFSTRCVSNCELSSGMAMSWRRDEHQVLYLDCPQHHNCHERREMIFPFWICFIEITTQLFDNGSRVDIWNTTYFFLFCFVLFCFVLLTHMCT